jgi:hypothetical protein
MVTMLMIKVMSMVQEEINSLFEGKKPRQVSLKDFA